MTPTEQDNELRAKLAKTKTFNYDVYFGQDIANNCIPFEEALDEIMQFITADRKRVALEARLDELIWSTGVTYKYDKDRQIIQDRLAELKQQQSNLTQKEDV